MFSFRVLARFVRYSLIAAVGIAGTTLTAYEATHMWIENIELAPEKNEEAKRWGWDLERDKWTGGDSGGTDPFLGFSNRHRVRAAWSAQNWGAGSDTAKVISSSSSKGSFGSGGLNVVETGLEYAQDFLRPVIDAAIAQEPSGRLRPHTVLDLLMRRADILERMGSRDGWFESRSEYERVWTRLAGQGPEAPRVALKLGDLNHRLGNSADALAWWSRAIQQSGGDVSPLNPLLPAVPSTPPSSPSSQRALASAFVSLSAFYATTGQLRQAQTFQEASLNLLRSIRPPESFDKASAPQALHALYLLHRSALITVHHAEVLYALRQPAATSVQWLTQAAESSERVALLLTGLPATHPDAPLSKIPHPPSSESPLLPIYKTSVSMQKPAKSLLRDARRSAAEAWNLVGILSEKSGDSRSLDTALQCYERALGWAGVAADTAGGIGQAGEGILDAEWKALWANYVRVRDSVRSNSSEKP